MHDERYPVPTANFEAWYTARMREITHATDPHQIEDTLQRIREYVNAKWCFAYRLSDAQSAADKVRKKNGWSQASFSDRIIGEGRAA